MDEVAYMIRGTTREVCQRELVRLCLLLGARPTMMPSNTVGPGWIARAVLTPKAPTDADAGRGPAVSD